MFALELDVYLNIYEEGKPFYAGVTGAQAIAQSLSGMKKLVHVLVRPSDIGGEEGRQILDAAAVQVFGREKATDMLRGHPQRANDPWVSGLGLLS